MPDADSPCPIHTHLREHALDGRWLSVYAFVQIALFAPQLGYYSRDKTRVGRSDESDFYTAKSLGEPFGRCVNAALRTRAGADFCAQATLVEIGAEPGQSPLPSEGFAAYEAISLGQPISLPSNCVVFSNELFDAQPFETLQYQNGHWTRMGVDLQTSPYALCALPSHYPQSPELERELAEHPLPSEAPEGYRVDLPVGAHTLLRHLCEQDWQGLFVAFDYGKDFAELLAHNHEGTARAYYKHTQHNTILENAGQQDITHHICWDAMESILNGAGFTGATTQRQESFLLQHAAHEIEAQLTASDSLGARRALMELLHPTHMGSRFQVLSAWRRTTSKNIQK